MSGVAIERMRVHRWRRESLRSLVEELLLWLALRSRMRRVYGHAQVACAAMLQEPELKPSGECLAVVYKCV